MSDLRKQIAGLFARESLIKPRQKMLVGVSGGLDSMVLLHLLRELASEHRWQLGVVHVNHGLRGRASGEDERFVRRTAEHVECPFFTEKHDVRGLSESDGISIEMAARKVRHETMLRVARAWRCRKLALAHHLDDQVELFFLRLLRGAGARGLGGMEMRSAFPPDARITVLRPLLEYDRETLAGFAKANRIQFREDATNQDEDILRNRVRHRLLPMLKRDFQPALKDVVVRSMELLRDSEALAAEAVRLSAGKEFAELALPIQRRVLHGELIRLGVEPEFDLIHRLLSGRGQRVSAPGGLSLRLTPNGEVELLSASRFQTAEKVVTATSGEGEFAGLRYHSRLLKRRPRRLDGPGESFDAERIGGQIRLRHWRAGDRFQPIGLPGAAKLQDLFVNAKVPRDQRRKLVVMENEAGEIVWVEGLRIGEVAKIQPETRRFWRWQWKRIGFD